MYVGCIKTLIRSNRLTRILNHKKIETRYTMLDCTKCFYNFDQLLRYRETVLFYNCDTAIQVSRNAFSTSSIYVIPIVSLHMDVRITFHTTNMIHTRHPLTRHQQEPLWPSGGYGAYLHSLWRMLPWKIIFISNN